MRRYWWWTGGLGLVAVGLTLLLPSVRAVVLGIYRGEATYRGKPTSYWVLALTDRDEASVRGAMEVLKSGGAQAAPMLVAALRSDDPQARLQAAEALGALGSEAVPALIDALQDDTAMVRIGAARALGRVAGGASGAVPALATALADEDPLVAKMAAAALGHTGALGVAPLVDIVQNSKDTQLRIAAIDALARIGKDAGPAVDILVTIAQGDEDRLVAPATEAVKRIDPQAAAKAGLQ